MLYRFYDLIQLAIAVGACIILSVKFQSRTIHKFFNQTKLFCMVIRSFLLLTDIKKLQVLQRQNIKNIDNVHLNVILMGVRVTIVAVSKQEVLHILSACPQPQLSSMESASAVLHFLLWHVWVTIFFHIILSRVGFQEEIIENKMCVLTLPINPYEIFRILRRTEIDIATNVDKSSCKVSVILVRFQ